MITPQKGFAGCFSWLLSTTFAFFALCATALAQAPAPDPFVVTSSTAQTIGLSWNDLYEDEDGFRLDRFDQTQGTWVTIAVLGPNVTSYLDTGLNPGDWYSYQVVSFDSAGDSFVAYLFAQATPAPAPEPLLVTAITGNTIRLSWNDIYSDEDGFRVSRYDQNIGSMVTIAWLGPNVTEFLDTGLIPGQWYNYEVVAFNSGGDSYRAYTYAQATPVPAPDPLQVIAITGNTIRLSWNDIYSDEDGFRVSRYDQSIGSMVTIAWLGANVTEFLDTGLVPGEWYNYEVVAFNSGGDSYRAFTYAQATPVPAPDPLLVTAITGNTIRLSWNDIYNDEDGFRVSRYDQNIGSMVTIAWLGPNVTEFLDTGLIPGQWYNYEVVAFNSGGDSYRAYTYAQATPVPAPDPLLITAITGNTIRLSWNDIYNDEDGFRVSRYDQNIGSMVTIAWLGPNVTEFLDTDLIPGEWYNYEVVAFNSGGDSYRAYTYAQATPIPAPEPLLIENVTANTIALSWNDIYNDEDGFRLQRFDQVTGSMITIAILGPNVTEFLDTGLITGQWYSYEVLAFNSGGDSFRAFASAQATPVSSPGPLQITGTTANTISMAWSDIYSDEDGFRVKRFDWTAGTMITIATLGPDITNFRDTGLIPGETYYYEVVAFNSGGESYAANNSAQATPIPAPDPLIATSSTATTITLQWNDLYADEDGFRLERSEDSVVYGVVATLPANQTNFVDVGLAPEHFYIYRVAAFNSGGDSYYSATLSAGATPVPAPDPLTVSSVSATEVGLSWNDIYSNEDGFRLERSMDSVNFGTIASLPANSTNFLDSNLLPNTFYVYRVLAFNTAGDSYYSMTLNATTLPLPPFTPSGLTTSATSQTQIGLSWVDNANNEISFAIERSSDGNSFVEIGTAAANSTTYSDTTASAAATYYYRVRASNAGGNSPYSNTATTSTPDYAPSAPSNLTATASSTSQINLSWTDNSNNETSFEIERSSDGVSFLAIASVRAGVTAYANSGLSPATQYTYRVRAANSAGNSGYSNPASATTFSPTPPAAPSNLALAAISSRQINLSWSDNASNETQYFIEVLGAGNTFKPFAQLGANAQSYAATGLNPNTRYTFRVRCSNAAGYSGYSNAAEIKTLK
jgi:fibronectin type 3 domain-containing protein